MHRSRRMPPPHATMYAIAMMPKRSRLRWRAATAPLIANANVPARSRSLNSTISSTGGGPAWRSHGWRAARRDDAIRELSAATNPASLARSGPGRHPAAERSSTWRGCRWRDAAGRGAPCHGGRSGGIDVAQRPDQAAGALVWLVLRGLVTGARRAQFGQAVLARHARSFGLDVHRPRRRRRPALVAEQGDLDLEGLLAAHDPQRVAHAHAPRGLGALAGDFDLAGLDRLP